LVPIKKNLSLTLFREKHTNHLQIYYGASLLECIPDDPGHIGYRSAGGRLYNAGLDRQILSQTFKVDRRTLQSWGCALLLDDKKEAVKILSGQRNLKLTPEIIQFAKIRFLKIYPDNRYGYSKQIREEIEEVFEIKLSGEVLRKKFNKWKDEIVKTSTDKPDGGAHRLDMRTRCCIVTLSIHLLGNLYTWHMPIIIMISGNVTVALFRHSETALVLTAQRVLP